MKPSFHQPQRGAALIICLSLLVVVCIVLVGFVTTARTERQTASSHLAAQSAAFYAGIGTDVASARLLNAVTEGSQPGHTWASGPGRIAVVDLGASSPEERIIQLYSGEVAAASATPNLSVNLNPASLTQGRGIVMQDVANVLPQQWIYVRKNGTQELPESVPAYDKNNPIVGRYAFWTDDLTARLNWNTASSRTTASSQPLGHPAQVDLTSIESLTDLDTAALRTERNSHGLFSTLDDVRRIGTAAPSVVATSTERPFDFTHFSHAPSGKNVFGDARLALTTQASRVDAQDVDFFDILTTPNTDPGSLSNISTTKVQALFQKLYTQLSRTDWPQQKDVSFVTKYGAHNTAQIILNMIEYVRSAESTDLIVEPIRGRFDTTTGAFTLGSDTSTDALVGNSRRPMVTEVGVVVPQDFEVVPDGAAQKKVYRCQVHVEIHWPANAGGALDLVNDCTLHVGAIDNPTKTANEGVISAARVQGSPVMNPGDYRVVAWPMDAEADQDGAPPSPMYIRVVISKRRPGTTLSGARVELAPPTVNYSGLKNVMEYIPARGVAANAITSLSTDDPFVSRHRDDWRQGPNTFGAANASSLTQSTSTVPPQDTDASGKIVGTSVRLPERGKVIQSLGELGRIHSGIRSKVTGAGTPWRTLRLQPDATPDQLPDWALLDLFRVPDGGDINAAIHPFKGATGGLVNLNSDLQPFASSSDPKRLAPLTAVFKGAADGNGGTISTTDAETLVEHIRAETLAGRRYGPAGTYLYPGEVVEIQGVADQGESREVLVGQVIDLLTTRSNTFAVYSIGQSIRQSQTGNINVSAEKRTLTVLELNQGAVKVVYQQDLGL